MKDLKTWQFVVQRLKKQRPVLLLVVVESIGSSPGRQGFKMAVDTEGVIFGSIGGGMMEHKLVELAKEKLKMGVSEPFLKRQIHSKEAAIVQSGMICSGEQTVLFYFFTPDDLSKIEEIIESLTSNTEGSLSFSQEGFELNKIKNNDNFKFINQLESWSYVEKIGFQNQLYIVGGGHCAYALSKQMRALNNDFYISLFDDRGDLNTFLENDFPHQKKVVDYHKIAEEIPSGENVFVVIMTFGYRTDDLVLRGLLEKKFKYLGILGSESKIKKMFLDLKNEGVGEEILNKIHAPIGLIKHTKTPEEIAVSIAAEIIEIKNNVKYV